MSRPYSWYPLAGSDPVPGDPAEVERAGARYQEVAETIAALGEQLASVTSLTASASEAVDEVRARADSTLREVATAETRYEEVATALETYARSLREAQELSVEALHSAQSSQHAVDAATTEVTRASRALHDAVEPEEEMFAEARLRRARTARDDAEVGVARARAALEEAIALRDQAAQRAAEAIRRATDGDGLNDGWWDNWGRMLTTAVSKIAGLYATVVGVLALVLCWVPIVGQALAAVALVAGAVALLADVALLIAGDGSWSDVIWGVVGVASFGVGRAVGAVARASSGRLTGMVHLSIRRSTPGSRLTRHRTAQRLLDRDDVLPRYQAQGYIDRAAAVSPIREALLAYRPSSLAAEIRDGMYAAGDTRLRAEVLRQGVETVRVGQAGGLASLGAALRAESTQTVRALDAAGTMHRGLSPMTGEALRHGATEATAMTVATLDATRDLRAGGPVTETWNWMTEETPQERLALR